LRSDHHAICQFHQHSTLAFASADPKSAKKTEEDLIVFSAHLESACEKAARRTLIKLTPGITKTRSFKQENLSLESKYFFSGNLIDKVNKGF
jgi:hypothetical protein